jgi:hypothetical protein
VPEHLGPDPTEFRPLAGEPDDVIHGPAGKLRLRSDGNSQGRLSSRELGSTQLIAGYRVLDR